MKINGYRWYIKDNLGEYEPNDETFATFEEALSDGHKYYTDESIGIDYCEDDEYSITVLNKIKIPSSLPIYIYKPQPLSEEEWWKYKIAREKWLWGLSEEETRASYGPDAYQVYLTSFK